MSQRNRDIEAGRLLAFSLAVAQSVDFANIHQEFGRALHALSDVEIVLIETAELIDSQATRDYQEPPVVFTNGSLHPNSEVLQRRIAAIRHSNQIVFNSDHIILTTFDDLLDDPSADNSLATQTAENRSLIVAPIYAGSRVYGRYYAWSESSNTAPDTSVLETLDQLASVASMALERAYFHAREHSYRQQADALLEISQALGASLEIDDLIDQATRSIRRAIQADIASSYMFQDGRDSPAQLYSIGASDDEQRLLLEECKYSSVDVPIENLLAERREVLIVDDIHNYFKQPMVGFAARMAEKGVVSCLAIPVMIGTELSGVIYAWRRDAALPFDHEDTRLAQAIANQLATGMDRIARIEGERRERRRTELLLSLARDLNREIQIEPIIAMVTNTLEDYFSGCRATILLANQSERHMHPSNSPEEHLPRNILDLLRKARAVCEVPAGGAFESGFNVAVPLLSEDQFLGGIIISGPAYQPLNAADHELMESFAQQTASALERALLFAAAEQHIADLSILQRLDRSLTSRHNLLDTFDHVATELRRLVEYTVGAILFADSKQQYLENVAVWGDHPKSRIGMRIPIARSIIGQVYQAEKPRMVGNTQTDPKSYGKSAASWRSMIAVPLMSSENIYGIMLVGHIEADRFTERDLQLVTLIAGQTAHAIYQAHESERQRDLYLSSIEALAAAVDAKDATTHAHARRVADIASQVAADMSLRAEEVERIELAGLLHDVGKIGIPDRILSKPGNLDPEERLIMMSHADLGAQILARHPSLNELVSYVRHHHEWFDGRGYPDGIGGSDVPIGAAILAVVDAFETMTSDRPYRTAMSVADARRELIRCRGTQFDPVIVDVLLDLIDAGRTRQPKSTIQSSVQERSLTLLEPIRTRDVIGLRVLTQIAEEIGQLTNLTLFIDHVEQIARDELRCAEAIIWLYQDETGKTRRGGTGAAHSLPAPEIERAILSPTSVLRQRCLSIQPIDDQELFESGSTLIVPLVVEETIIGLIEIADAEYARFDQHAVELLQAIAGQVAPTIRVAQMHDLAKHAAMTDGLTGVLNHRSFYQQLDALLESSGNSHDLHVLITDMINLKTVNDTYGHIQGDRALKLVASTLVSRLSDRDIVARYGGDEFAVILSGPLNAPLESIVECIEAPIPLQIDSHTELELRLRCGYATLETGDRRSSELVARADALLFHDIQPTKRC